MDDRLPDPEAILGGCSIRLARATARCKEGRLCCKGGPTLASITAAQALMLGQRAGSLAVVSEGDIFVGMATYVRHRTDDHFIEFDDPQ